MSTNAQKFETTLLTAKKTATGIRVPDEVIDALGGGKRPALKVTINGFTYQTTVGSMDGVPMIPVSAEIRGKAGVEGGDKLSVEVELDNTPREVALPEDFAQALEANAAARTFFETLSNSNKKRFTLPIEQAKTSETRNKRIEKAIADLAEGKKM